MVVAETHDAHTCIDQRADRFGSRAIPVALSPRVDLEVGLVVPGDRSFVVRDDEIASIEEMADPVERVAWAESVECHLRLASDEGVPEERHAHEPRSVTALVHDSESRAAS